MAPEQLSGKGGAGAASDLWAMGVTLYECLSGELPFVAPTPTELFARVMTGEFAPLRSRERAKDLGEAEAAAVERALSYEIMDRYSSATEMARVLERLKARMG